MYKFDLGYIDLECKTLQTIEANNGKVIKNSDGTIDVYFNNIRDYSVHNKSCCEVLGYNFDINTQKCYWSSVPNEASCSDCTTKVVYNTKDNDGTLFNVNDGETCSLDISLDYILKFDCDLFSKVCNNDVNSLEINKYTAQIKELEATIKKTTIDCETLTTKIENATNFFDSLCYVVKGIKTTPPPIWTEATATSWVSNPIINLRNTTWTDTINSSGVNPFFNTNTATTNTTTSTVTNTVNNTYGNVFNIVPNRQDAIPTFYADNTFNSSSTTTPLKPLNTQTYNNIMPLGNSYNNIDFSHNNLLFTDISTYGQINNDVPPPFAWQWKSESIYATRAPYNTTTSGPVSYCLTERGLALWADILGEDNYDAYISSFGCDEKTYTQQNFNTLLANVDIELNKDQTLKQTDFITQTTQGVCDKSVANKKMGELLYSSEKCKENLQKLNDELNTLNNQLTTLKNQSPNNTPISNLENLQVYLNLEVENSNNEYVSVYEELIFGIGEGNLLNYILTASPDTGILISGETSNGILTPPFGYGSSSASIYGNSSTSISDSSCETSRAQFIKDLYLQQYKGVYDDPTTAEEELNLNKNLNNWYNSSWLYYNRRLDDTIISQILNKKIKISLRIQNCCLDLCVLTDNLNLTKTCESLHNQEIIISESPKFEIEKVLDNKKSWVSYTENSVREHDLQFRETQYDIDDYRLSVNTKEIDLKIDGSNAIEEDVLCVIDCLISGDTGTTVTGTCCVDKCDYGYTSDMLSVNKYFNNGKYRGYYGVFNVGYQIKPPLYKALDTFSSTATTNTTKYYQNLINQGIWVPTYPTTNVHVWWDNSIIDEIEGTTSCDPEDYASWNRAHRDAAIKAKNQLALSTAPFDWATYEIPTFVIEKYYLNRECSTSEFRVGEAGPGGYVAYVDATGQHGLIFAIYNSSTPKYWHATDADLVGASNDGIYSGETNTTLILSTYGSESNAAKYCSDYTSTDSSGTTYNDYYLPSKYELDLISQNWSEIGVRLPDMVSYVWSSTENDVSTAWAQNIYDGTQVIYNKSTLLDVIVVRKF